MMAGFGAKFIGILVAAVVIAAAAAQAEWEKVVSGGDDPTEIPEVNVPATEVRGGPVTIVRLLALLQLAKSNNEARQKVTEGAVTIGPERMKITDPRAGVDVTDGMIVRLGSRRIVRVRLT